MGDHLLPFAGGSSGTAADYASPGFDELALDANGTKLYALDYTAQRLARHRSTERTATIVAGHIDFPLAQMVTMGRRPMATLNTPQAIAIADSGAVYIAGSEQTIGSPHQPGWNHHHGGSEPAFASSQGVDGTASQLPVDRPIGVAFDAFGNSL